MAVILSAGLLRSTEPISLGLDVMIGLPIGGTLGVDQILDVDTVSHFNFSQRC